MGHGRRRDAKHPPARLGGGPGTGSRSVHAAPSEFRVHRFVRVAHREGTLEPRRADPDASEGNVRARPGPPAQQRPHDG